MGRHGYQSGPADDRGRVGQCNRFLCHAAKKNCHVSTFRFRAAAVGSAPCRQGSAMQCGKQGRRFVVDVYPVAGGVQPRSKQPETIPLQEQGCEFGRRIQGSADPAGNLI